MNLFHVRNLLASALLVTAAVSQAQTTETAQNTPQGPAASKPYGDRTHGPRHGANRLNRLFDKINATPDQRQKISEIVAGARAQTQQQHKESMVTSRSLQDALTAATLDTSLIQRLSAQREAVRAEGAKRMTQTMIDIAQVLTPEQRQQLNGHLGAAFLGAGPGRMNHGGRHFDKMPNHAAPKSPGE
jgi:periplasmic protein CpxP/Spy